MYGSLDMVRDRQTDRKSDIYRWVPHLKIGTFFKLPTNIANNIIRDIKNVKKYISVSLNLK